MPDYLKTKKFWIVISVFIVIIAAVIMFTVMNKSSPKTITESRSAGDLTNLTEKDDSKTTKTSSSSEVSKSSSSSSEKTAKKETETSGSSSASDSYEAGLATKQDNVVAKNTGGINSVSDGKVSTIVTTKVDSKHVNKNVLDDSTLNTLMKSVESNPSYIKDYKDVNKATFTNYKASSASTYEFIVADKNSIYILDTKSKTGDFYPAKTLVDWMSIQSATGLSNEDLQKLIKYYATIIEYHNKNNMGFAVG